MRPMFPRNLAGDLIRVSKFDLAQQSRRPIGPKRWLPFRQRHLHSFDGRHGIFADKMPSIRCAMIERAPTDPHGTRLSLARN